MPLASRLGLGFDSAPLPLFLGADYGMACDGTTDDTAAAQATINAVAASGAGTIQWPAGTCVISQTVTISSSLLRQMGGGGGGGHHDLGTVPTGGTIFKWAGAAGGTMMQVAPVTGAAARALTGVGIENVTFNCAGNNTAGIGLQVLNVRQSGFANLVAYECSAAGIDLNVNSPLGEVKGITQNTWSNIETDNFQGGAAGIGIRIGGDATPSDGNFETWTNLSLFFKNAPGLRLVQADNERFFGVKYFRASGGAAPCALDFNQSAAISQGANSNLVVGIGGSAGSGTATPFCAVGTGGSDGVANTDTSWSSLTGDFSSADVGKGITGTNIPAATTIASVTDPQHIVLSQATTATATALAYTVTGRTAAVRNTVLGMDSSNGESLPPLLGTGATATYQDDHGRYLTNGTQGILPLFASSWASAATAESRAAAYGFQNYSGYFYNGAQNHIVLDDNNTRWAITEDGSHNLKFSVPSSGAAAIWSPSTFGAMALGNNGTLPGSPGIGFGGSSSGSTALVAGAAASGVVTLPAATDTLVGKATTDTLTNKTLTDPVIQEFAVATGALSKTSDITFAVVPGLSIALTAGKTYSCYGHLRVSASGASGGIQIELVATSSLTATSTAWTVANFNGTTTNARTTVTALGSAAGGATAVVTDLQIDGTIVVNAAGTINVEAAQNASNSTTTTVAQDGSTFRCVRVN